MADKKPIILKTFNNTFSEFLKELCGIFPKNKEIKAYKNSFSLASKLTPKAAIGVWNDSVNNKYYDDIMRGDLDYFLTLDYSADLSDLGDTAAKTLEFIESIKKPLSDLDKANKDTSIAYIQNLCKLSYAYNNN
tara:strand:+ start:3664 stop:4065 length:402 start_codon:yes stop_codon:yes gene_type:complete